MQLRICWPNPDATCLEGGCIHCDTGEWVEVATLEQYAKEAGSVVHRNGKKANAFDAFAYGRMTHWFNQRKRESPTSRPFRGVFDNRVRVTDEEFEE